MSRGVAVGADVVGVTVGGAGVVGVAVVGAGVGTTTVTDSTEETNSTPSSKTPRTLIVYWPGWESIICADQMPLFPTVAWVMTRLFTST
jgi:hypothetical protein